MSKYTSGKYSSFERDFRKRFVALKETINKSEKRLGALGNKILSTTEVKPQIYWKEIRKQIDAEYAKINKAFSSFSRKEIPKRFRNSVYQMTARIEGLKSITATAKRTATSLIKSNPSTQIVQALYQDSIARMLSATFSGKKNMESLIRATQQVLVDEAFINRTVVEAFDKGNVRKAKQLLTKEFNKKLALAVEQNQFITIKGRNYNPKHYAELLLRTKFHEAHSKATRAVASNYGTDLVIISSHNTTTKICIPFEGKVYSLSGQDKRFPPLQDEPPFHPNCLHLMYPQFESGMEAQGSLDGFIEFSNGNRPTPPFPSNFKPTSKRATA